MQRDRQAPRFEPSARTMNTDLYRFFDSADRLLYVGISLHAAKRASEHRKDKPWWSDVARMEVEHLGPISRQEAEAIERQVIQTECPAHNVTHNGERTTIPPHLHDPASGLFASADSLGLRFADYPDHCRNCKKLDPDFFARPKWIEIPWHIEVQDSGRLLNCYSCSECGHEWTYGWTPNWRSVAA